MKTSNAAHWKMAKRMAESNKRPILTDDDFLEILFGWKLFLPRYDRPRQKTWDEDWRKIKKGGKMYERRK